jgi:hypothetical protein
MIAAKTHSQIIHRRGFLVAGTAATALTPLNDAITREAFPRSIDCIDLRILRDDDRDFANPIEPPVHGGAKIAGAILNFAAPGTPPYPRVIAR